MGGGGICRGVDGEMRSIVSGENDCRGGMRPVRAPLILVRGGVGRTRASARVAVLTTPGSSQSNSPAGNPWAWSRYDPEARTPVAVGLPAQALEGPARLRRCIRVPGSKRRMLECGLDKVYSSRQLRALCILHIVEGLFQTEVNLIITSFFLFRLDAFRNLFV